MPAHKNRPRDLRIVVDKIVVDKIVIDAPPPTPKVRRQRPGHLLKPGSRAAFTRGCTCYTLPGLVAEGRDQHQAQCPLRQKDIVLKQKDIVNDNYSQNL